MQTVTRARLKEFPYIPMTEHDLALTIVQPALADLRKQVTALADTVERHTEAIGTALTAKMTLALSKAENELDSLLCDYQCELIGSVLVGSDGGYCPRHARVVASLRAEVGQ